MRGRKGQRSEENEAKPLVPFQGQLAPLRIQTARAVLLNKAFTCDVCHRGVGTKGGLKYHIQAHLNGRRFKCDKCPKSYATKNDLETHYKRHLQQFTCDICGRKFSAKDYLMTHISGNHLPKTIPCVDCCNPPKKFSTRRLLHQHYSMLKNSRRLKEKIFCKLCGYKSPNRATLKNHIEERKLLKYQCQVCTERFPCHKLLLAHAKEERAGRHCKMCKKWVGNYRNHVFVYHQRLQCEICKEFETTAREEFKSHVKNCGTDDQVKALGYQCTICETFFRTKVSLDKHMNGAHPRFWCERCSRGYHYQENLTKHNRSHKIHRFRCLACPTPKNFLKKDSFDNHFKSFHSSPDWIKPGTEKTFYCDICKLYLFLSKEKLIDHIFSICAPRLLGWNTANTRLSKQAEAKKRRLVLFEHNYAQRDSKRAKRHPTTKGFNRTHQQLEFECDHCSKRLMSKHSIENHISAAHLPKMLPCVNCCEPARYYATHVALQNHYKHKIQITRFRCRVCCLTLKSKEEYQKHCEEREQLRYECVVCRKKFPCPKLLPEHYKEAHSGNHYCKKCSKWVSDVKQHHEEKHIVLTCQICKNYEATGKKALLLHVNQCGDEEQIRALNIQCKKCKSFFRTKAKLHEHRESEHPAFWCAKCSMGFQTIKSIKNHTRVVHEKYNAGNHYKCILCPRPMNFSQKKQFDRHFRTKHGIIPGLASDRNTTYLNFCDNCKTSYFRTKSALAEHIEKECSFSLQRKTEQSVLVTL